LKSAYRLGHQYRGTAFQRTGDLEDHRQGRCMFAALDLARV
jgi:hypothetical protein